MTLPQLAEHIRFQTAASKMALPWLKLAIFGNKRSEKNSLRTNENVLQITGIEVEHDAGEIAFGTALATILKAGVRCILYTSPSYVPGVKERWRILLPLSSQLSARDAGENGRARQRPVRRQARARKLRAVAGLPVRQRQQQSRPPRRGDRRQVSRSPRRSLCRLDLQGRQQGWWKWQRRRSRLQRRRSAARSRKDDDPEPVDRGKIEAALNVISSDCNYKTVWMPIGGALHYALGDSGFELFDRWSAKAKGLASDGTPRYTPEKCRESWRGFRSLREYTTATIFHFADQADPGWRERLRGREGAEHLLCNGRGRCRRRHTATPECQALPAQARRRRP